MSLAWKSFKSLDPDVGLALGVRAERCIAVEDSPRGLASARAAGISCVIVPHELTSMLEFPGALAIEDGLSGVLNYIELARTA